MAPLYHWLTEKELNGKADAPVGWNFQKFMIDEQGNWVDFVEPRTNPLTPKIIAWLEQ
jgi:glutathione peroxidase